MSMLTRDGTVERVSRDQLLRRERGQGKKHFHVQLTTSRIDNFSLYSAVCICYDHTYSTRYSYLDSYSKSNIVVTPCQFDQ